MTQIIGLLVLYYYVEILEVGQEGYVQATVWVTGVINLIVLFLCLFLYRRDEALRRQCGVILPEKAQKGKITEGIFLLFMGAAFSQFGNMVMAVVQEFFPETTYYESMSQITDGKSIWMLVLWLGIIGPIAEEYVFRGLIYLRLRDYMKRNWAIVISSAIFGIYHMNVVQAIYAWLLGMCFAYLLEMTGDMRSCVLLHVGANIWSLFSVTLVQWMLEKEMQYPISALFVTLLFVLVGGFSYFYRMGAERGKRAI